MESSSVPSSGIFSLQVLIILGVTVALVSAVAVILYNKIQNQGEKLSAVMELSTVLAQELRSHDVVLKQIQSHTYASQSVPFVGASSSTSPRNIVFANPDDDIERIYVSDGSGNSDDEYSENEIPLKISQHTKPSTLDNILMNPMCFGPGVNSIDTLDNSSDDENYSGDESNSTDEDMDNVSCDTLSIISENVEDLSQQCDEELEAIEFEGFNSTSSGKRMITLSDVSIDCNNEDNEEECNHEEENDTPVDIHKVVMDMGDNIIDYKKMTVNELRRLAIERQLIDKGSKMKKTELVDLLTNV